MKDYINLTEHNVVVFQEREFKQSGVVAYLDCDYSNPEDGVCTQYVNNVVGLPEQQNGVNYIVSPSVMDFMKGRGDLVTLPLEHPDTIVMRGLNGGSCSIIVPFLVLIN